MGNETYKGNEIFIDSVNAHFGMFVQQILKDVNAEIVGGTKKTDTGTEWIAETIVAGLARINPTLVGKHNPDYLGNLTRTAGVVASWAQGNSSNRVLVEMAGRQLDRFLKVASGGKQSADNYTAKIIDDIGLRGVIHPFHQPAPIHG